MLERCNESQKGREREPRDVVVVYFFESFLPDRISCRKSYLEKATTTYNFRTLERHEASEEAILKALLLIMRGLSSVPQPFTPTDINLNDVSK